MRSIVVRALLVVLCACGSKAAPPISGARAVEKPADRAPESGGPYDYKTWTAKLGDPDEAESAVTELEQLGNPGAIPALGEAWRAQGRPVRMLQVIVSLSRPLTPEQAFTVYLTDYEKTGRKASWNVAMPFLVEALTTIDIANPRSVDSATKAADAIGEAQDPAGIDALIALAIAPVSKKSIVAQISAIRALGTFAGEKKRAGAALAKLVDRDPPAHPRTASTPAEGRELEERFGLYLGITGASINAVGELRYPPTAKTLVLAMYRTPELFMQIRRALVATGPAVKDELRKILRGESKEVNELFASKRLDTYCDKGPPNECYPLSAKDFYPAIVLGDFYDAAAVPDLLAAAKRPAHPVYFIDDQPSPNTQHNAIFDALRKIGSADAAAPVRAIWMKESVDLNTRILAIGSYPFVARDEVGVDELGKIAADNTADDSLRQEAATAFARLSTSTKSITILDQLAAKYLKASADKRKQADGKPKRDADAADKALEVQKKILEKAKSDLIAITNDSTKTAAEITTATAAVRKVEDNFKAFKKKHKDAVAPYKQLDSAATAYRGFARMFQTHIARIEIAIRCKQDLACYAGSLKLTPNDSAKNVAPYMKDIGQWTDDERRGLVEANIERAMLEIGKRGDQASQLTDTLLVAAKSDNRLVRQSILLALPKIAKIPCDACDARLEYAIKVGEGKTTLGDLNLETAMLRNYFAWAGRTP